MTDFYCHPQGKPTGDGSADHPWDLVTALTKPLPPSSTLWRFGGVYRPAELLPAPMKGRPDKKVSGLLKGEPDRPVVCRNVPGQHSIIDVARDLSNVRVQLAGAYVDYYDLHIMSSDPRRRTSLGGSDPADIPRESGGFGVSGPNVRLINPILHDMGNGVSPSEAAIEYEIYGGLIFNNGWSADRGHGHGVYAQNFKGRKVIDSCVAFNNFGMGARIYGENAHVENITFRRIVSFENGQPHGLFTPDTPNYRLDNLLVGGTKFASKGIIVEDCHLYHSVAGSQARLGYGPHSEDFKFTRNYVVGGAWLVSAASGWDSGEVTDNFFSHLPLRDVSSGSYGLRTKAGLSKWTMDRNRYHHVQFDPKKPSAFLSLSTDDKSLTVRAKNLAEWQKQTGFDKNSTYSEASPKGVVVDVQPNIYQKGRAHIVVHNFDGADSVEIDLSGLGFEAGSEFEVRDVQNLFGKPIHVGRADGRPVKLPLNLTEIKKPIGMENKDLKHTGKEFNCFLVLPRSQSLPRAQSLTKQ